MESSGARSCQGTERFIFGGSGHHAGPCGSPGLAAMAQWLELGFPGRTRTRRPSFPLDGRARCPSHFMVPCLAHGKFTGCLAHREILIRNSKGFAGRKFCLKVRGENGAVSRRAQGYYGHTKQWAGNTDCFLGAPRRESDFFFVTIIIRLGTHTATAHSAVRAVHGKGSFHHPGIFLAP